MNSPKLYAKRPEVIRKIGLQREAFLKAFKAIRERERHLRALTNAEKDLLKGFSGKLMRGMD